jgi:hypothetical protein
VLAGFCLGDRVLWVGSGEVTAVGNLQRGRRRGEGGPGGVLLFLPYLTAWVGAGEAGLDRGSLHEHGYRLETNGNSEAHSELDFSRFCPPGVRSNARKKLKFEFFEICHFGWSTY